MNEARADHRRAHDRDASRVTAGPHDVGFTWRERPSQRQDVWEPARRDSQEVHMVGGLPRLKTVMVEGPVQRDRRQRDAEPRADFRLPAGVGRRRRRRARRRSSRTWRAARTVVP